MAIFLVEKEVEKVIAAMEHEVNFLVESFQSIEWMLKYGWDSVNLMADVRGIKIAIDNLYKWCPLLEKECKAVLKNE